MRSGHYVKSSAHTISRDDAAICLTRFDKRQAGGARPGVHAQGRREFGD